VSYRGEADNLPVNTNLPIRNCVPHVFSCLRIDIIDLQCAGSRAARHQAAFAGLAAKITETDDLIFVTDLKSGAAVVVLKIQPSKTTLHYIIHNRVKKYGTARIRIAQDHIDLGRALRVKMSIHAANSKRGTGDRP